MTKVPILIIEDDHDIRVCFRQALENQGFQVYSVSNGKDALILLKNIPAPKLIILDLGMPIMNGEEFIKLKNLDPNLSGIPILIASCYEDRAQRLEPNPSILKPVDVDSFVKKVVECLSVNKVLGQTFET